MSTTSAGAGPVRLGFQVDVDALDRWMASNVPDYRGPLKVMQFSGGQSNPTYKIETENSNYVLRKKPPGSILRGAHAIDREFRIQSALALTGFPVPTIFGYCSDPAFLGSEFYVMEMLDGRIFWDASLPEVNREERPLYYRELVRALAQLHSLQYEAIGLSDFGKGSAYVARQIDRWSRQYDRDREAGRDEHIEDIGSWLTARLPDHEPASIIHGDYRIDNVVFHPTEARIIGVLDWELSTIGNPIADFAYHLMMYRLPPTVIAGLLGCSIAQLGIPNESEHLAMYCRLSGRPEIADIEYYLVFNMFRLAAIIHGIKGRNLRGNASSSQARELTAFLPHLTRMMRETADAC